MLQSVDQLVNQNQFPSKSTGSFWLQYGNSRFRLFPLTPPPHHPVPSNHVSHSTRHWCFSQARPPPLSLCVRSVSLTNLLWFLLLLFLRLRALPLSAQGTTECPCEESGTLSYSWVGPSHRVQFANQHVCASVLLGFLWEYCSSHNLWWCANVVLFCILWLRTLNNICFNVEC